jgi:hypothetical protein
VPPYLITLILYSFNVRAKKAYEKIGFKIIGNKREALLRGKERHDIILMDILYKEFYDKNNLNNILIELRIIKYGQPAHNRSVTASPPNGGSAFTKPCSGLRPLQGFAPAHLGQGSLLRNAL